VGVGAAAGSASAGLFVCLVGGKLVTVCIIFC